MAHEVWFEVPQRELGRADIVFSVWRDGKKLGTLEVSKGSVVWIQGNRSWGFKAGWVAFDEMMEKNGTRWEKRRG
jgi:hypothetical protein